MIWDRVAELLTKKWIKEGKLPKQIDDEYVKAPNEDDSDSFYLTKGNITYISIRHYLVRNKHQFHYFALNKDCYPYYPQIKEICLNKGTELNNFLKEVWEIWNVLSSTEKAQITAELIGAND